MLQVLLADWAAKQGAGMLAGLGSSVIEEKVAALDAVLESSGALSDALAVEFKPACIAEALGAIHDHVLNRIKECVTAS